MSSWGHGCISICPTEDLQRCDSSLASIHECSPAGALQLAKPGGYFVRGEACFLLHALSLCLPWPTRHGRSSVTSLSVATLHPLQPLHSCCCSTARSCPIICDPTDCSTPGFPVLHHLPEFTQTHVHQVGDAIQPSHPLSSPSPCTFNLSQHQDLFQ